jgi:fatty acid desaturase
MKKFINSINWKKFFKVELWCIGILLFFYFTSPNKFPHNFYAVPIISGLFGIMLLVKAHTIYLLHKKEYDGTRN